MVGSFIQNREKEFLSAPRGNTAFRSQKMILLIDFEVLTAVLGEDESFGLELDLNRPLVDKGRDVGKCRGEPKNQNLHREQVYVCPASIPARSSLSVLVKDHVHGGQSECDNERNHCRE